MNIIQSDLIKTTENLPNELLKEVVDFAKYLKHKYEREKLLSNVALAEKDIEEGNVSEFDFEKFKQELDNVQC